MLDLIKRGLDGLDESLLPDSRVSSGDWTRDQYRLVEKISRYHQYLWYESKPSKKADKLLDRLSKFFNQDGGYIYQG
jgi:hypothetical protein